MLELEGYLEILLTICFLFMLYSRTHRPRLKEVKPPKPEKQGRKKRLKYLRRLRIPYRGKAQIIKFDKTSAYIESAWNEIQKPRKK